MADHEEQCNCDQALELRKLLVDARQLIGTRLGGGQFGAVWHEGFTWVRRLTTSWAFRDPAVEEDPVKQRTQEICDQLRDRFRAVDELSGTTTFGEAAEALIEGIEHQYGLR